MTKDWLDSLSAWLRGKSPAALNLTELRSYLGDIKGEGVVPKGLSLAKFRTGTQEAGLITELTVTHVGTANARKDEIVRFGVNKPSALVIAQSLRSHSFLSHATALFLHGVTEQLPQTIFVNKEQTAKPKNAGLTQTGIDRAFRGRARQSQYVWAYERSRITMLNGKQTGNYGVEEVKTSENETLRVTNLERTLVDILVRPGYAGGVIEVLTAFKETRGSVSVGNMLTTLQSLDYTYPYHQALGFMMERAGYDDASLAMVRAFGVEYNFYLDYNIRNPVLDSSWRLFVPQGL